MVMRPRYTAEEAVQARFPHLALRRESFESASLPAIWLCTQHKMQFRRPASALWLISGLGCPQCNEERALEKRHRRLADPELERHLAVIEARLGGRNAMAYRMRCEGAKLEEIGEMLGISERGAW